MIAEPLRVYLESKNTHYHVHEHPSRITAQEIAQTIHVSGKHFAKSVLLHTRDRPGGRFVLVVLPASEQIDLNKLRRTLDMPLELASEEDIQRMFPDYEIGAAPPLAECAAAKLPVFVDVCLTKGLGIAFNAGTHTDVVEMPWPEFERIAAPSIIDCGIPCPPPVPTART